MKQVHTITTRITPLDRSDVDTDQIIPAHWLKRVERTGFGEGLFSEWKQDPDFILNNPLYNDADVLVARENFGCGSSREHAPWALDDYGFEAIIAPSFADIFYNNCLNIGLVPVITTHEIVEKLLEASLADHCVRININVETKTWSCDSIGVIDEPFELGDFAQYRLLNGFDDIGLTLQHEDAISQYEANNRTYKPTV